MGTVENAGNPYLDLSEEKFPLNSWQADAVYSNHFLDAAIKLVERAHQAIFASYHGYGLSDVGFVKDGDDGEKIDYTMESTSDRIAKRLEMFRLAEVNLDTVTTAKELQSVVPSWQNMGGWTTERSFDGLQRRLTHAMMTNSDFVVIIADSWQSTGNGEYHASQSMPGVFENLLNGLFKKLGMNLVVRAISLPSLNDLGTGDQSDSFSEENSILADTLERSAISVLDADMVVWDYSDTFEDGKRSLRDVDESSAQLFDLFARQALSGKTIPFIWGGDFDVLRNLHTQCDVDVGQLGNGLLGVQETINKKTANKLSWAAQYLNCPENMQDTCNKKDYQFGKCWNKQSDITLPRWRMQQLKGYILSYQLLQALLEALSKWTDITISQGFPLPNEYWHVGKSYLNMQQKAKALDKAVASKFNVTLLTCIGQAMRLHKANEIGCVNEEMLKNMDVALEILAL